MHFQPFVYREFNRALLTQLQGVGAPSTHAILGAEGGRRAEQNAVMLWEGGGRGACGVQPARSCRGDRLEGLPPRGQKERHTEYAKRVCAAAKRVCSDSSRCVGIASSRAGCFAMTCARLKPAAGHCVNLVRSVSISRANWTHPDCSTRCDLVVAHCDEQLGWLVREAPRYRRTFLYSKCGRPPPTEIGRALGARLSVVRAPNLGSNDYAVVQHVIQRYAKLAELTVFCEAGLWWNCIPDAVARPAPRLAPSPYVGEPSFASPDLACLEKTHPYVECRVVSPNGSHPITYAAPARGVGSYSAKGLARYAFRHSRGGDELPFHHTRFPSMAAWLAHTVGNATAAHLLLDAHRLVLGGYFSAERGNLRRYPLSLYRSLRCSRRTRTLRRTTSLRARGGCC